MVAPGHAADGFVPILDQCQNAIEKEKGQIIIIYYVTVLKIKYLYAIWDTLIYKKGHLSSLKYGMTFNVGWLTYQGEVSSSLVYTLIPLILLRHFIYTIYIM